ncbi:MAG: HD domain-containing protein [Planctomycetes bacterium]|nr:HD domain-containing protein [Planctomycetota bacterium]
MSEDEIPISAEVRSFAEAIRAAGGRAVVVGGFVRDALLGIESKDVDLEVYHLDMDTLESVLRGFGEVITVGRAFGVLLVKGIDIDVSVPRRDNKVGRTHRDFRCEFDPDMSFEEAARRRDLTINAIGLDPLSGERLDPHGGVEDLRAGRLRATDAGTFSEDPLRALRVAQFLARFEMTPDERLRALCSEADLDDLPGERIWDEFRKLLLKARRPSLGLEFLRTTGLLRFFPQIEAMVGCPQDPEWHPEGDVWVHTLMVIDEAAAVRSGEPEEDLLLMYGALCHDLGKPTTTFTDEDGRIRSPNHEPEGVEPTEQLLHRLRAPTLFTKRVAALVRHHLAPAMYPRQNASPKAYRRLARRFGEVDLPLTLLEKLARADHFGRTTPDAIAREHPAGDEFLAKTAELHIEERPTPDVVLGRHLIARGLRPGRHFGPILDRCREIQDESGEQDPETILALVAAGGDFPDLANLES